MVDKNALFKLSYGLFVISTRWDEKDSACIINTCSQLTDTPLRISVAINKRNFTHDAVLNSKKFNISVLTQKTPFSLFENFGFKSSRDTEKFTKSDPVTANGIRYVNKYSNAVISANVTNIIDFGTHSLFIAEVTQASVILDDPSVTYAYYHAEIKPKPVLNATDGEKKYVCKICGWVYDEKTEGVPFEDLPDTWVCPLCKHPKSDFELLI